MSHIARPTAAPQTRQIGRFPWSERFDCIFRNEEVAGSNPASSTECPVQSDLWSATSLAGFAILLSDVPQALHKTLPLRHLIFCEGSSLTNDPSGLSRRSWRFAQSDFRKSRS